MKLYKITRPVSSIPNDGDLDAVTRFEGTQADARATRIELEAPFKALKPKDRPEVTVEDIDVPTDKKGLLEFLNGMVA